MTDRFTNTLQKKNCPNLETVFAHNLIKSRPEVGGEAGRCNTAAEPSQTWIKRPTKPVGIHQTLKLGRAYTVKPSPPSRSGQLVIPANNLREESLSIRRSESFPSVRLHLFQLSSGNTRAHEFRTSFHLLRILKIRTIYSISFNFSRHNTNFTVS